MKLGIAVARTVIGALFIGHGTQKLFGWFGGHGPEGTGQFFENLGLRPGRRNATAAGAAEALGGALLATGLLTPLGAAMLTGTMATAIRTVHGPKGPWVTEGGYEYNLVLIAALFALTDAGPGRLSLDRALGLRLCGTGWALAELGAGLAASEAIMRSTEAQPGAETSHGDPATAESSSRNGHGSPAMATA